MLIYKITGPSNKIYIGQTSKDLRTRMSAHKRDHIRPIRACPLYNDMLKYGFDNFKFEVVQDNINDQDELDMAERYWIGFYDSCNLSNGYNQDNGGKSGCKKSKKTKEKIGKTTKEKWENEYTATRMMEGLRKGTETVKKNAANNFVELTCLYCGRKFYVKPHERRRMYCSTECHANHDNESGALQRRSKAGSEIIHAKNVERKSQIREFILDWCSNNVDIVKNCPKNKITGTLSDLFKSLHNEYGMKDKRSYYICFDVNNLKDFLKALQDNT